MRTSPTRTIAGRINSDGTIAVPGPFTVRRTGTGTYVLGFPGLRVLAGTVTPLPNAFAARWGALGSDSATIESLSSAGGNLDAACSFTAVVAA